MSGTDVTPALKRTLWPVRVVWRWTQVVFASLLLIFAFGWLRLIGRKRIPATAPEREDRLVVMLVISNLTIDPRVEREARTLAANGFRVKVICPQWDPPAPPPDWGPRIAFEILSRRAGYYAILFPYVLGWRMWRAAARQDGWVYHAHDLNTALPALLAAAGRRVPCICDFHEWFSENVDYDAKTRTHRPHAGWKRRLYRLVERMALHHATAVITVCQSIAELLEREFQAPRKVHVIRNIPILSAATDPPTIDLRAQLGISPAQKVVMYQGGLGATRYLEPIVEAMAQVDNAVLVIRGPAIERHAPHYLAVAREAGAAGRVFCVPGVPANAVVREAAAADIGVWSLLANVGLNFRLALPNKIFEYLAAGIPVLAADLPEAAKIVNRYGVGACFDPTNPKSIAAALRRLAEPIFYEGCKARIPAALADLRADKEWAKLVKIYSQLRPERAASPLLAA